LPRPVLSEKIFRFAVDPKQQYTRCRPVSQQGRFGIVTDVRRDEVDASNVKRRMTLDADGEVVWVLIPRRWDQVSGMAMKALTGF